RCASIGAEREVVVELVVSHQHPGVTRAAEARHPIGTGRHAMAVRHRVEGAIDDAVAQAFGQVDDAAWIADERAAHGGWRVAPLKEERKRCGSRNRGTSEFEPRTSVHASPVARANRSLAVRVLSGRLNDSLFCRESRSWPSSATPNPVWEPRA